jgi:hypothetical protein
MAQPTPPFVQPPPDLPNMPEVSNTLSQYLRTFSLWCKNSFANKLDSKSALPGITLIASDDASKVFLIQVSGTGAITATPVAVASGTFPP